MRYFVIGDEDAVLGFRLTGVEGLAAKNREAADEAFTRAIENHEFGIIIITETVAELIRDKVDSFIFTEQFPLILEIPDRLGKLEGRRGLREMVSSAIGVNV